MEGIRRVEQRHISVEEAKQSREVFLVGSSLPIMPVVQVRSSCRVVEVPPHAGWGACVDYPVDGMRFDAGAKCRGVGRRLACLPSVLWFMPPV